MKDWMMVGSGVVLGAVAAFGVLLLLAIVKVNCGV